MKDQGFEPADSRGAPPNLRDYAEYRAQFSWEQARRGLSGLPGGGLNIAHEAVGRHAIGAAGDVVALRWLGRSGEVHDITYRALHERVARFADALARLGVRKGDRVFVATGRVPELYAAALGTLAHGAVFCPLFSAFGPEPLATRMSRGTCRVLVTTARLYQRKIAALRPRLPALEHVVIIDGARAGITGPGVHDFDALMEASASALTMSPTKPDDPALLHFTSGTTGSPKGAVHVHEAALVHHVAGALVLDLKPGDVYWCTADPGWVTGTSFGIIAPLTNHVTSIIDEREFDAERWLSILEEQRVNVWYTAPTAIRMLMRVPPSVIRARDLSRLRLIASVGEPLNPEAVRWGAEVFGLPIHDNWWQTETGGIMIANYRAVPIKPGSMGLPLPGIEAAIVRRTPDGGVEEITTPDVEGELALRRGWPSMFREYLDEHERYERCFAGDYYLSGDLARRDADGYYWFVGRGDDVIKSAGHLVGPFEVESALVEHPAVIEAAVIGLPDPIAGSIIKAFVVLAPGAVVGEALERELLAFARTRLGPAVAPRSVTIVDALPHTRSGKIMRRLLRARELGLPEGDTSTLEGHDDS
ncbi:MAG: acetate--CoA ligase [Myxococcales bacterium]|nr:acetate--CoA ligase [Myxococcales bacterium]